MGSTKQTEGKKGVLPENIQVMPASAYPLGVYGDGEDLVVSARYRGEKDCGICLFSGEEKTLVLFDASCRTGRLFSARLTDANGRFDSYLLYEDGGYFCDPYAKKIIGLEEFGKAVSEKDLRCKGVLPPYDWRGDLRPLIPYEDCIFYCLNVRGFTMADPSVKAKKRGTFLALQEKIPYLKDLGVTTVELMPIYEIHTAIPEKLIRHAVPFMDNGSLVEAKEEEKRVNLWGYQEGYYFAPCASYAYDSDSPCNECKDMIRAFHENGMEVIMQFYFAEGTSKSLMTDCIRYWVSEYHIDGIHLKSDNIPVDMIATDPMLSDIKIMTSDVSGFPSGEEHLPLYLADYSDSFIWSARHFLKGDDRSISAFADAMYGRRNGHAEIHYITNYDGFTLRDLVTYEHKRNEANGEGGTDGRYDNISWNCGVEGESRKKAVNTLRRRQILNALSFVFLSRGTPLLYAGDEAGNTQDGNNNPYCQDNPTGWTNWKGIAKNGRFLAVHDYVRFLSALRKRFRTIGGSGAHKSGRTKTEASQNRLPELSFHGAEAWRPDFADNSHAFAALYMHPDGDKCLYVVYNMYWESLTFALPDVPKHFVWRKLSDTAREAPVLPPGESLFPEKETTVCARSVQIFEAVDQKKRSAKG